MTRTQTALVIGLVILATLLTAVAVIEITVGYLSDGLLHAFMAAMTFTVAWTVGRDMRNERRPR